MSKAFSVVLQDIRDGRTHAELSDKFNQLIEQVKDTGKVGELTLSIKIKPATRGGDVDKVMVSDKITLKSPQADRGEDFFFLSSTGELSRKHPKQQELPLRDASSQPAVELKEAQK